ncbi:MAG: DUF2339 domain-containing protein, partial [Phycisphaerales bacterium]|nr:DUF2339 domain-containing protein [Phycisphaerales bacterium]
AAYVLFELVSPGVAFGLLASVALLGIAIAARAQYASVGVVALLGGYLCPFLVSSENPSPWVMPIHLTVLLGLAVGLTAWRGPRFAAVRGTAFIGTLFIGGLWALASDGLPLTPVLMFVGATWILLNAEATRAVTKWAIGTQVATASAIAAIGGTVIATAWAFGVTVLVMQRAGGIAESLDWTVPLALAIGAAALAWRLVPDVRKLLSPPSTLAEKFACALIVQCLSLVPVAVALGLSDWLATWGIMAVAAALVARRAKLWPLAVYAVLLLGVTTLQLAMVESWRSETLRVGVDVHGVFLSRWMAVAAILGVAWLATARVIGLNEDERAPLTPAWRLALARLASVVGVGVCFALWINAETESRSLVFVLPVLASAILLISGFWRGLWVDHAAALATKLIVVFWLIEFVGDDWVRVRVQSPVHPGMWSSLLVAGAALVAGWRTGNPGWSLRADSAGMTTGAAIASGTLFVSTSFEVARVARLVFTDSTSASASVSVWWAALAIGLIVLGFAVHHAKLRHVGLGLLGLALLKVLTYDLAALSLEWRTVSFLVLGSVMLAVGLVYGKVASNLAKAAKRADAGVDSGASGSPT